eukprot:Em0009g409a
MRVLLDFAPKWECRLVLILRGFTKQLRVAGTTTDTGLHYMHAVDPFSQAVQQDWLGSGLYRKQLCFQGLAL